MLMTSSWFIPVRHELLQMKITELQLNLLYRVGKQLQKCDELNNIRASNASRFIFTQRIPLSPNEQYATVITRTNMNE